MGPEILFLSVSRQTIFIPWRRGIGRPMSSHVLNFWRGGSLKVGSDARQGKMLL
jgi:hypothetical protein